MVTKPVLYLFCTERRIYIAAVEILRSLGLPQDDIGGVGIDYRLCQISHDCANCDRGRFGVLAQPSIAGNMVGVGGPVADADNLRRRSVMVVTFSVRTKSHCTSGVAQLCWGHLAVSSHCRRVYHVDTCRVAPPYRVPVCGSCESGPPSDPVKACRSLSHEGA